MEISLPLEQMSIEEKIRAMEAIWDDLCQKADSIKSPLWHGRVLAERETRLKDGDAQFIDWEEAKKQIRDLLL
jgi:hypothetical protein